MILIKNGNVYLKDGTLVKTDILIEGQIIKQIAENINSEVEKIIDVSNKYVLPGFIDPLTDLGCGVGGASDMSSPLTPVVDSKYAVDDKTVNEEKFYLCGITSAGITLGDAKILGGQMTAIKTYSNRYSELFIKERVGLKGSVAAPVKRAFGKKDFITTMKLFSILKEEFERAKTTLKEDSENPIHKVLRKEIPLFMTAETENEINMLIETLREFDINLIIVGAYEALKCMDKINERGINIMMGDQMYMPYNVYEADFFKLKNALGKDQMICLSTSSTMPKGPQIYRWSIANLRKMGYTEKEVLEVSTIVPAKMLGIDDKVGSLDVNKDADIIIWSKDPLNYYDARVEYAVINGEVIYSDVVGGAN